MDVPPKNYAGGLVPVEQICCHNGISNPYTLYQLVNKYNSTFWLGRGQVQNGHQYRKYVPIRVL